MSRYLLDAVELGHNPKGISRVLANLVPRIVAEADSDVLIACTPQAQEPLAALPRDHLVFVRRHRQSHWEQWGLPALARRLGATAVYSHRESGALWGPPLVLHVPEDPEVRWSRTPPHSLRERARRAYSRATMRRALRRATAAASSPSVADRLSRQYGVPRASILVIPLGVDLSLFSPAPSPAADTIFHLGSADPRDRTLMVVDAWLEARKADGALPKLVVGGAIGPLAADVARRAAKHDLDVTLTGRLSDADLAECYRQAAAVVQPSSDEGFGLQPLEAMASGAPVVVTRTAAVADVVGGCAVVCEPTAKALGSGILDALELSARLRIAARARAEGFSWDDSARAVLDALKTAASHASA